MKLRYKIANGLLGTLVLGVTVLALVMSHTSECVPSPVPTGETTTMKAVVATCYGSPDVLQFADIEKPVPGDDEILIKVKVASVNPLDYHFMTGTPYILRLMAGVGAPDDHRIGSDFSGTVEAIGKDVTKFQVGQEVFGGGNGAFAEYLIKHQDTTGAVVKPGPVSHEQAASIPIAGITALQAVRDHGKIKPGDKVLINGASGGVGTLAVQIAKHYGADVTGVCSTRNVEMVRSLGADRVIDYKTDNYTQEPEQYDVILDMVGNHSISDNRNVLKPEGRMVMVGGQKGNWIAPFLGSINSAMIGPFIDQQIGSMLAEFNPEDLTMLADLIQSGELEVFIGSRFPLAETADAMRISGKQRARGKLIIEID